MKKNYHWTMIIIDTDRKMNNFFNSMKAIKASKSQKLIKIFIESFYMKKNEKMTSFLE